MSKLWQKVAQRLEEQASTDQPWAGVKIEEGQRAAIREIGRRIADGRRSQLLADEVGMGKTLIAATLIDAVAGAGGRVAVLIPPGLGSQWRQELGRVSSRKPPLLPVRSVATVLDAFRQPHHEETKTRIANSRRRYEERRQQKELPENDWRDESIVLLSHHLGSFRWTDGRSEEIENLLKQVQNVADGKKRYARSKSDKVRRDFAEQLCGAHADALYRKLAACDGDKDATWRKFQVLIGHALGKFDLVVLDEAHKARGRDTSISRMLEHMLWKRSDCFHLGLTATPVELDYSQWHSTLVRLDLPAKELEAISQAAGAYDDALAELWRGAFTEDAVNRFEGPARKFENALKPWMLRRDLRDDPFISRFNEVTKEKSHRERRTVAVPFGAMSLAWKRAFLAGEALALRHPADSPVPRTDRRQRFSMATGIDADPLTLAEQKDTDRDSKDSNDRSAEAWRSLAARSDSSGYRHPLLIKAVELIEERTARGEKVLVFGRFNKPLRLLTDLLDMRELVRRLADPDRFEWPQMYLSGDQKRAFAAALENAPSGCEVTNIEEIDGYLTKKYRDRERQRKSQRDEAVDVILSALREKAIDLDGSKALLLWQAFEMQVIDAVVAGGKALRDAVSDALDTLIVQCRDTEEDDAERADDSLKARLDEFLADLTARTGHFASFLSGVQKPQTRRNLQVAFNRHNVWPRVLVAQSKVASEGLNLQESCRTIVMLHPEWNPATCEQQIGRVDRLHSLWRRLASEYMQSPAGNDHPPRIEVLVPYIEGTYAEHNLHVLETRWDRMRAELHGDIVTLSPDQQENPEQLMLAERVRRLAPRFAPV